MSEWRALTGFNASRFFPKNCIKGRGAGNPAPRPFMAYFVFMAEKKTSSGVFASGAEIADKIGSDLVDRKLLGDRAELKGDGRHSVDDAALLILPDGIRAALAHF